MLPTLSPSGDLVLHLRLPFLRMLSRTPLASSDLRERFPRVPKGLPSSKMDPAAGTGLRLGDMVVALSPADPARTVCKRVLGLPGDRVLVDPRDSMTAPQDVLNASVVSDNAILTRLNSARTVTVPKGHVWLAGDNLANSTDSRHYGPVPLALVKGLVVARLYPNPERMCSPLHVVR